MTLLADIILRDTRANQPAFGIEGRIYYVTDENVTERDSGAAWEDISDVSVGGSSAAVGARVKRSATDITLSSGVDTAIAFTAEDFDTNTFHDNSTNNTRLTVPSGMGGVYLLGGGFYADANCDVYVRVNGTTKICFGRSAGGDSSIIGYVISDVYQLSAGDYVELVATARGGTKTLYFDSGSASPHFSAVLLGT